MSWKDLRKFFAPLREDLPLQKRLRQPGADSGVLVRRVGYAFSLEEWQKSIPPLPQRRGTGGSRQ